jgi:2-polyprenyl-3-methyl-5-hydroxy-6-metoxy-1,4-benzoquinol methylase
VHAHLDRLYESYASTHAGSPSDRNAGPALERYVCPRIPADRSATILDIGCGQGDLLALLHRRGYQNATGIDISGEQLDLARAQGVTAAQADLFEYLPKHPRTFDAVVALDVFEHLPKERLLEALDAVARALRPGGRLIGRVPNGESPFFGRYRYGDFTHTTAFTRRSLAQVLRAACFTQIDVAELPPVVHGARSAARAAVWKAVSAALKGALAAETGVFRGHLVTQNVVFVARVDAEGA